jgi:hypothetical protein
MLSLEKCKDILEKDGGKYSPEQIKKIRDFLEAFTIFVIEDIKHKKNSDEGNTIHSGING